MPDPRDEAFEQAIGQAVTKLAGAGFTQQQWRALTNVFNLAKEHPALDEKAARIILERIEKQFAEVRDRVVEENRRLDDDE